MLINSVIVLFCCITSILMDSLNKITFILFIISCTYTSTLSNIFQYGNEMFDHNFARLIQTCNIFFYGIFGIFLSLIAYLSKSNFNIAMLFWGLMSALHIILFGFFNPKEKKEIIKKLFKKK